MSFHFYELLPSISLSNRGPTENLLDIISDIIIGKEIEKPKSDAIDKKPKKNKNMNTSSGLIFTPKV